MSNLVCTSCKKQKLQLKKRKSKLRASLVLHLCSVCFDKKYEPRYAIIMLAQTEGVNGKAGDYIKAHRYFGDEITAREIMSL